MTELETYFDNTQKPWGKLFYQILWSQLSFAKSLKILDFGSGFGITANHLAALNEVIAIEPNQQMCDMRLKERGYTQIIGGIETVQKYADESYDMIICHNVLEYIDNKEEYISAFHRLLKPGGKLSLVKHNRLGKVMQKAIFENNIEQAIHILEGGSVFAQYFGSVKAYENGDCNRWMNRFGFKQIENLGIRTFFALHPDNAIRFDDAWIDSMLDLELKASRIEAFRNIAFYNHVILEKL